MLAIFGSAGSGKSHLVNVISELSGVSCAEGHQKPENFYVLDPVTCECAPHMLLDLVEDCRASNARLILSGCGVPSDWAQGQKDLFTRLEAMPRICMPEPDEDLMRKVIARHIQARQFDIPNQAINTLANYAAERLPRTYEAAAQFTRALDLQALSEQRRPGTGLARQVIEAMQTEKLI